MHITILDSIRWGMYACMYYMYIYRNKYTYVCIRGPYNDFGQHQMVCMYACMYYAYIQGHIIHVCMCESYIGQHHMVCMYVCMYLFCIYTGTLHMYACVNHITVSIRWYVCMYACIYSAYTQAHYTCMHV